MHPNPRRIAPVILLIALAAAGWWYLNNNRTDAVSGELAASGTIEAIQVLVAPELAGHVLEVLAQEGDAVQAGDVLVRFDGALLQAQLAQAQAALAQAQANYELAAKGLSDEQRALAVASAEMELTNAQQALQALYDQAGLAEAQI